MLEVHCQYNIAIIIKDANLFKLQKKKQVISAQEKKGRLIGTTYLLKYKIYIHIIAPKQVTMTNESDQRKIYMC